jgi:hypothetical protein
MSQDFGMKENVLKAAHLPSSLKNPADAANHVNNHVKHVMLPLMDPVTLVLKDGTS